MPSYKCQQVDSRFIVNNCTFQQKQNLCLGLRGPRVKLLLPPQRFRPENEIPRRHSRDREESVGNDVFIVCAASTKWLG